MIEMKYCGKPLIHTGEVSKDFQQGGLHNDHSPYYQAFQQYRQEKKGDGNLLVSIVFSDRPGRRSETYLGLLHLDLL